LYERNLVAQAFQPVPRRLKPAATKAVFDHSSVLDMVSLGHAQPWPSAEKSREIVEKPFQILVGVLILLQHFPE
jgi:hypothetical protein